MDLAVNEGLSSGSEDVLALARRLQNATGYLIERALDRVPGYFDQPDSSVEQVVLGFAFGIRVCLLIGEKQPTILRRGNSRN